MRITPIDSSELRKKKTACLRLDLEQDFGDLLGKPRYDGLKYVPRLAKFLKEKGIPLTCFVQGSIFAEYPEAIEPLSALDVEFELHSYSHPNPKEADFASEIIRGTEAYRDFFHRNPRGYSAPLGFIDNQTYDLLATHGFEYDSSVCPSIRPGVFNNLATPLTPYMVNDKIIELPLSVFSPFLRISLSLSYMVLLGKPYRFLLRHCRLPDLVNFNFHLHDLFELDSANLLSFEGYSPVYRAVFRKIYRERKIDGLMLLGQFIEGLRDRGYTFSRIIDVYESISHRGANGQ